MDIPRSRDCYILSKGETFTVAVDAPMATAGWKGGQGVQYVNSSKDELTVELSTGYAAGFLVWGSNEVSDQFTAMTGNQSFYRFATIGTGGIILTPQYEVYTWASRQAGPLVPITYSYGDRLVFSLRGYWTKEDELSLSGDPRGPNSNYIGHLAQIPTLARNNYMAIEVMI